jgi:uncharacterized protein YbbC (DUF1343 family)/CubicO group peptidase (beta-lactamase class C family)
MRSLALCLFLAHAAVAQQVFTGGPALDAVITEAIKDNQIPGAVVMVGHNGQIVYQHAYGFRARVPREEPMTMDTIFDAASLTKVIATTSSIMKLEEEGKIRLSDPVTKYLPTFQGGKSDITIRNLMTHSSGMRPDLDLLPVWSGYETGIQKALAERSQTPPATKFVYSDINFILLGEIVRRASGESLAQYAHEKVFAPLGMKDSMFQPPASLLSRIAPTEVLPGTHEPLRGVVHDPTARDMGGVAGHAGLFTTAADLSKFAEMMLNFGERNGVRVFSPLTVRTFTSVQSPPDLPMRGLGWDINSPFATNRGDLFPIGSYGHTGFTGTSIWIDPFTNSYVILMTNAVHLHARPGMVALRSKVATIAAAGLNVDAPAGFPPPVPVRTVVTPVTSSGGGAADPPVLTGLDLMNEDGFSALKGKRVGLITNHTGISRDGKRNIDLMVAAGVKVNALFSPEHGIAGKEDREGIGNSTDTATGIRIWSLYGSAAERRPSDQMLNGVDALVFDIQDVGARFYTYTCTMLYAMEEAAKRRTPFYVLDRPNPITGTHVEGPMLDADLKSFVGCYEIPLRHGMTIGELATMFNSSLNPKADLHVVAMKNWRRDEWFDSTGLTWIDPSPNMRSLNAAILYPGIAMLEAAKNYSVGRGTDAPFEQIGADWIRGRDLAAYLNARNVPGIRVYATRFQPASSNFAGKMIEGVRFVLTERDAFDSSRFGLELGAALQKLYPGKIAWASTEKLVGSKAVVDAFASGADASDVRAAAGRSIGEFRRRSEAFLLY